MTAYIALFFGNIVNFSSSQITSPQPFRKRFPVNRLRQAFKLLDGLMHLLIVLVIIIMNFFSFIRGYNLPARKTAQSMSGSTSRYMSMNAHNLLAVHVNCNINKDQTGFLNTAIEVSKSVLSLEGVLRYDILQNNDDKSNFLLIKVFTNEAAMDLHKETIFYKDWTVKAESFITEPRQTNRFKTIFPFESSSWNSKAALKSSPFISKLGGGGSNEQKGDIAPQEGLFAVAVSIKVVDDKLDEFIQATLLNCKASLLEPGVTRFDFLQHLKDPTVFSLVEVYNDLSAPAAHKATAHYAAWASTVSSMMARPRSSVKYTTVFPSALHWHQSSHSTHAGSRGLQGAPATFGLLAPKITMGRGIAASAVKAALKEYYIKNPLIVTGSSGLYRQADLFKTLFDLKSIDDLRLPHFGVRGEPTVEEAEEATLLAKSMKCDGVLAVGGGSAIDLGKAVAALASNPEGPLEYLEVIGRAKPLTAVPLPLIAVPTTSGTGSEVLKSKKHGVKASIRHDTMLAKVAIIDPVLSASCPPDVTAHVGLDTLCQVIEPFVSNAANPFTDALARDGILRASRSLRAVVADGSDISAREDLAVACVLGGLCLANAKLGAVHGFAAVLGGMFDRAPHGAICAALLPIVFRVNANKLKGLADKGDKEAEQRLERFAEVARIVTGNRSADAAEGALWLAALVRDLRVPGVRELCDGGIDPGDEEQLKAIAKITSQASSTKGNPIPLSEEELVEVLRESL